MHVKSANQSEIRITLETAVVLANGLETTDFDVAGVLREAGFSGIDAAKPGALARLEERLLELVPLLRDLPSGKLKNLTSRINVALSELPVSPSMVDHDDIGLHLHWTPATASLDDRIITDLLVALAHEMCDTGTSRFGRCAAADCDDLFYDGTRNHSRRFCADQRCATRTHTAEHRARQREDD